MLVRLTDPENLFVADLTPVAVVTLTLQELENQGVEFTRGSDDLDDYSIAAFRLEKSGMPAPMLEDESVFALQAYDHEPGGWTTLLLQQGHVATRQDLVNMIVNVSVALGVPAGAFHWREHGENVSLGTGRDTTAGLAPV